MNKSYIYGSNKNNQLAGNEAIIVLPDIYGQTDYSKATVEKFAEVFGKSVFMLDYFYPLTGTVNDLSQTEQEKARQLMGALKGDDFLTFFQKVLGEIKAVYPEIKTFSVIGFCFGGRLVYIAGGEEGVSKVISFYGGGSHEPDYIRGKTSIEYLISKGKDGDLKVMSFYGAEDPSIPEVDRLKTKELLDGARISYEPHEYVAGHAYFQEGRKNYNEEAANASWEVLKNIFT